MTCKHWIGCKSLTGNCCGLRLFRGTPTDSECLGCDRYDGPSRGLGDDIARVTKATGIDRIVKAVVKDCGCAKRRAALNALLPHGGENGEKPNP